MTRIHSSDQHPITIPDHLLKRRLPLPCEPRRANSKEEHTLAVHRMLGCNDQQEGRSVVVTPVGQDTYKVDLFDGDGMHGVDIPFLQLVAALSSLEGSVLKGTVDFIKASGGETPGIGVTRAEIVSGVMSSAKKKILNAWDGNADRYPWAGVGIIAAAPDGSEFAFARKDHLHPRVFYNGRLGLMGGNIDPNEILSSWGDEAACARVGMLRETFEEIRDPAIAHEIALAAQYHGPARANCYLYEDDGQCTQGTVRAFLSLAPSMEAWQQRWRPLFTREGDGLGEAFPEIVTREQLSALIRRDSEAARARKEYLKRTPPSDVLAAEEGLLDRSAWSRLRTRIRKEQPDLGTADFAALVDRTWKGNREEDEANGRYPLMGRGDFGFIAGHAAPIAHVLQGAGIEI